MKYLERLLHSSLTWYNQGCGLDHLSCSDDHTSCRRPRSTVSRRQDSTDQLREPILLQIFELLANLAWFSEAPSFFAKVKKYFFPHPFSFLSFSTFFSIVALEKIISRLFCIYLKQTHYCFRYDDASSSIVRAFAV
ncbi:unnamed protein product [Taenia asiatica]|uniref:Uncharacterized protein n=1 Tax=Taenia asiatica TaxID=60517 RepID=A0A0R3VXB5_TAEAS|nr:unnamed protein product [Taenia asiatica]